MYVLILHRCASAPSHDRDLPAGVLKDQSLAQCLSLAPSLQLIKLNPETAKQQTPLTPSQLHHHHHQSPSVWQLPPAADLLLHDFKLAQSGERLTTIYTPVTWDTY